MVYMLHHVAYVTHGSYPWSRVGLVFGVPTSRGVSPVPRTGGSRSVHHPCYVRSVLATSSNARSYYIVASGSVRSHALCYCFRLKPKAHPVIPPFLAPTVGDEGESIGLDWTVEGGPWQLDWGTSVQTCASGRWTTPASWCQREHKGLHPAG